MKIVPALASGLLPSLCAACARSRRHDAIVCTRCARRLAGAEPLVGRGAQGLDRCWSSASHEGVARDLVTALKFRRLLPVAGLMAERIEWLAPASLLSGSIVPVPTSRLRTRRRGFDPAAEIAAALAERTGLRLSICLGRSGGGHQVGRRRGDRLGHPPRVRQTGEAPRSVLLVDDVVTTGATLSARARALRGAGATPIVALTLSLRASWRSIETQT